MIKEVLYEDFKIDIKRVQKLFNGLSYHRSYFENSLGKRESFQPADVFFKKSGIDLRGNWNLGGLNTNEIEYMCRVDSDMGGWNMFRLFQDLQKLNKGLRKLRFSNSHELYGIVMGISSGFNVDDIEFYIGDYGKYYGSRWDNLYKTELYQKARGILYIVKPGIEWEDEIQWIMSPESCRKILNILLPKGICMAG